MPTSEEFRLGESFGRYLLIEELGRGGMGVVFKAWDAQLRRTVALKVVRRNSGVGGEQVDQTTIERFHREAQNAAQLHHPQIVQVYDVGVHNGEHYFTMDFLEGEDLCKLQDREGCPAQLQDEASRIALRRKLEILVQVASALDSAHQQGIIHRDLKPANIIVTKDRGPVITDFGLAKDVKRAAVSGLTISGQVLGTPAYMAPQQALGNTSQIGPHTDVFAIGVMLYEMITGFTPFFADTVFQMMKKVVEDEATPPSTFVGKVPRDLETICLKALAKEPSRRVIAHRDLALVYSDMGDPAKAIEEFARILEIDPDSDAGRFATGNVYFEGRMYKEAIAEYDEAIRMNPNLSWAIQNRGVARLRLGDLAGALEDYDKAIELNPRLWSAYNNRGFLHCERKELEAAMADFNEALRLNANYAPAYVNRGNLRCDMRDYDGAIADYDKAVELDSNDAVPYYNRGLARAGKGDPDGALADYNEAIRLRPGYFEAYGNRGNVLRDKGQLDAAIESYNKAIEIDPKYPDAYANRGVVRGQMGDTEGAIADFEKALEVAPPGWKHRSSVQEWLRQAKEEK